MSLDAGGNSSYNDTRDRWKQDTQSHYRQVETGNTMTLETGGNRPHNDTREGGNRPHNDIRDRTHNDTRDRWKQATQ